MKRLFFFVCIMAIFNASCKKESFITSAGAIVNISADTIHFDTVFTSVGSVTHLFKILNSNNQKLKLSSVRLAGGENSSFSINVDGIIGPEVNNIEIEANDSLYVFVSVEIDPTQNDIPFIIEDSIAVSYNGNTRWVQLQAFGQNAIFLRSQLITGNQLWTNEKPIVILGGVVVDKNAVLTIEEGAKIYLHADAPFIVDGTLKVEGALYDSTRVYFQSDRLDEPYRNFPGSWPGIYFREDSHDNVLNFAVIKNAYQGIVVDKPSMNGNPKIVLNECIIDNCYDAGILAVNSSIVARNCLVSNTGKGIILVLGGNYTFQHCTGVSVSNSYILHKEPVLLITNFIKEGNTILSADLNASFDNCIFWGANGTVENEVVTAKEGAGIFNVQFRNSLWKIKSEPASVSSTNMINENPLFDSINTQRRYYNFRLKDISPAIDKGILTPIIIDLDGKPRNVRIPDMGSYERE